MSLPSLAEVDHADWSSLKRMCDSLGLNPKGRSAVVRMRVLDHVRHRTRPEPWAAGRGHIAALLTRLGFADLSEGVWESTIQLDAPAPWIGLGQSQLTGGFLGEATKSFVRAVQMGDASGDLHRAEALAAGGDFDGAARSCDAFLSSRPTDLRALIMKAGFLARAGFVDEATKTLEAAVDLHPDVPGLSRTLGVALLKIGHHGAAAEAFHEAVRRDPNDLNARVNRGSALLLAGRTREATGVLREVLGVDSHRADALNNLGVAYLVAGQTRSASVNLGRAARHLESPRVLLNLAKLQEVERERAGALRSYEQVLRIRPKDSEALAGRKRVAPKQSQSGRRKAARPALKKTVRRKRRRAAPRPTASSRKSG